MVPSKKEVWSDISTEHVNCLAGLLLPSPNAIHPDLKRVFAAERKSSAARRMALVKRNKVLLHLHRKIAPIPAGRLERGLGRL
jgi:hypothetical protein